MLSRTARQTCFLFIERVKPTIIPLAYISQYGAPKPVKAGTKVKNIRLRPDSDHNIDCKIDGFGAMALKSEFVKKA